MRFIPAYIVFFLLLFSRGNVHAVSFIEKNKGFAKNIYSTNPEIRNNPFQDNEALVYTGYDDKEDDVATARHKRSFSNHVYINRVTDFQNRDFCFFPTRIFHSSSFFTLPVSKYILHRVIRV